MKKNLIKFPDPRQIATVEDIIFVGGELSVKNLVNAYDLGIFPWPHEGYPLLWFCPDQRGVLFFDELQLSRSLKKWIKKNENKLTIKINTDFDKIMSECASQKRKNQNGTWITQDMIGVYSDLSQQGGTICVGVYLDNQLVAGIYGVKSKNYFSCESMFFKIDNGSKFAFLKLIEYLKSLNLTWMDLQMVTDISSRFGGRLISKKDFLRLIESKS